MTIDTIIAICVAMGIPTAITAICSWTLQRRITAREHRAEELEQNREKLDVMLLQSTTAAIALGEATARAVQRIPDAHCNGDMHKALDYAAEVKHQQKNFLTSLGVHALHDD